MLVIDMMCFNHMVINKAYKIKRYSLKYDIAQSDNEILVLDWQSGFL